MERMTELLNLLAEKVDVKDTDLVVDVISEIRSTYAKMKGDIGPKKEQERSDSIRSVINLRTIMNEHSISPENYSQLQDIYETPLIQLVAELKVYLSESAARSMYGKIIKVFEGSDRDFDYYKIIGRFNELLQVIDTMTKGRKFK